MSKPKKSSNLTDKQKRFCEEYLTDMNATQAAIRSGYSAKTARQVGSENLSKPDIQAYIRGLIDARSERTEISADFVIQALKEVAERCMQRVPAMEFNYEERRMEQKVDEEGNTVWEFDSSGANRSLELLGKHLGIFEKDNRQKNDLPKSIEVIIVPPKNEEE
ncbi:MAG TPA: terminase small subunit [Puia sp.]